MNQKRSSHRSRSICLAMVVATAPALTFPLAAHADSTQSSACATLTVAAGETYVVPGTAVLCDLTIEDGGVIAAAADHSLTLTVNGVETGGKLTKTGGTETRIAPGRYRGRVVLTVADANPVPWQSLTFPFRQGLYVDGTGVVQSKSVLAAVTGGRVTDTASRQIKISSTGEAFNGVYVKDGTYTLDQPQISLTGNGRSDFVGYGAAVTATGSGTTVVLDGAQIANQGSVRTGVVADGGSNVIVKNSAIDTKDGVLPNDYRSTVDLTYMQQAPWMLGIVGNVRATNLLGDNTKASYINSAISSQGWGVLSTDTGSNGQLTTVNSSITTTGGEGYGSYAIGGAVERFLGSRFTVDTYATINRGGAVYFADSTRKTVSQLNTDLKLGLTAKELAAIPVRPTVINSDRWGVMWHGAGSVDVSGGTVVNTRRATFLDKGQQVAITVDGSQGAKLKPGNGILLQMMEDDDPGPQMVNGELLNTGVYHEPTGDPAKVDSFDVTAANAADAVATFSDIRLKGDFYNAIRGGSTAPPGPGAGVAGKNMVLTFDKSQVSGVISAAESRHAIDTITAAEYEQLGQVTNTPRAVVNNGVIVNLDGGSRWKVTGTSYLSKLVIGADSAVTAAPGHHLSLTVDGVTKSIVPGTTYTGSITLTVR